MIGDTLWFPVEVVFVGHAREHVNIISHLLAGSGSLGDVAVHVGGNAIEEIAELDGHTMHFGLAA
jgi:hypothetical protein